MYVSLNYKVFILLLFITSSRIFSQTDSISISKNIVYLEAGGHGGYGSINYERLVYTKKLFTLSARIGLGTYHIKAYTGKLSPDLIIPLALEGCYGKTNKIELGIGQTTASTLIFDKTDFSSKRTLNFSTILLVAYRYQKKQKGFFFRCAYTPIIEFNTYFRHWAGLAFGYSF